MAAWPMRWIAFGLSRGSIAMGCRSAEVGTSSTVTIPTDTIPTYRTWDRLTPTPVRMDPVAASLCIPAQDPSPHTGRFAQVYVNDLAQAEAKRVVEALERGKTPKDVAFPPGSIFVKAKIKDPRDTSPTMTTIMEKLEPGLSPETGDWKFSIRDGKGEKTLEDKQPGRCYSCHSSMPADKVSFLYIEKR